MWENLHKCFERWREIREKVGKKFKKVIEKDEKKGRGAEKRGEIGYLRKRSPFYYLLFII
jgi:hypothetical protein